MVVVEVDIPFQNLQKSEKTDVDAGELASALRGYTCTDVSSPTRGNQVAFDELEAGKCVVAAEAVVGMSKFCFQCSLGHAVVCIHEGVRAVCRAKHPHGMAIGA